MNILLSFTQIDETQTFNIFLLVTIVTDMVIALILVRRVKRKYFSDVERTYKILNYGGLFYINSDIQERMSFDSHISIKSKNSSV